MPNNDHQTTTFFIVNVIFANARIVYVENVGKRPTALRSAAALRAGAYGKPHTEQPAGFGERHPPKAFSVESLEFAEEALPLAAGFFASEWFSGLLNQELPRQE